MRAVRSHFEERDEDDEDDDRDYAHESGFVSYVTRCHVLKKDAWDLLCVVVVFRRKKWIWLHKGSWGGHFNWTHCSKVTEPK